MTVISAYQPENVIAKDEPLQFLEGAVAIDATGPHLPLTPLMLDAVNKRFKLWDGTPGTAKCLTVLEVDSTTAIQLSVPLYKAGSIKAAAIQWPTGTTDQDKSVAFVGSPISVFL